MKNKDNERAEEQARAQVECIAEMVDALHDATTEEEREDAMQRIQEDPLSVEVRTDWHTLDADDQKPTEFRILLCTGGPAARIVGDLDEHGQPENPVVEFQDWFTPWLRYTNLSFKESQALLEYCRCFYFGE